MPYRKLIRFGDSSYVVSLPKKWVDDHKLSKGDLISLREDGAHLFISPASQENGKKTLRETSINVDELKTIKHLKSQLSAAYVNNFDTIVLRGDTLSSFDVSSLLSSFIALEIVQKSKNRIVLKDFLNIDDLSLPDTLRRVHYTLQSMLEDMREALHKGKDCWDDLKDRDRSINSLSYLIFKALKRSSQPSYRERLGLDVDAVIFYWNTITLLEDIGNQLKRIAALQLKLDPSALSLFDQVSLYYGNMMTAFFKKDQLALTNLSRKKGELLQACDTILEKYPKSSHLYLEKLKNIITCCSTLGSTYLRYVYT